MPASVLPRHVGLRAALHKWPNPFRENPTKRPLLAGPHSAAYGFLAGLRKVNFGGLAHDYRDALLKECTTLGIA